jgi:hypothetical protein
MRQIPQNCWEWDGYLGECVKYHPAQWWQYPNVISILILVAGLVAIAIAANVAARLIRSGHIR